MRGTLNYNNILSQIADIKIEKLYTPYVRVLSHIMMWLFLSIILYLNYYIEFKLSIISSVCLTARAMVNNAMVFYLFFYCFPRLFHSKRTIVNILYLVIIFFICVVIWLFINYIQLFVLYNIGFEVNEYPFKGIIKKNAQQGIGGVLSIKTIIGNINTVIFSFIPPFFVKILFDTIKLYRESLSFQKQKLDLEIQNINIEKEFLKAQLNPHFLFNTLNNLYGLVVKQDSRASEVVLNLSDIMAYTLYECSSEKVMLDKELEFIENYFNLEKLRHPTDREITLEIYRKEDISGLYIAPLITFTFIENAFKYGLKSRKKSFLKINIKIDNKKFLFSLKNDKSGNNNDKKYTNIGGIGLENVKKRLQLLYPDSHLLEIEDTYESFNVYLEIVL
ncbi:sensor histidine kinase [Riemerella anatipestifer]|nr:sensor histidine kinase [Riemerella anatipestifer]